MNPTDYHILLLDDDEIFVTTLARLFKRRGYPVHCSQTIDEACRLMKQQRFDVAVVDLRIGEESGLDAVNALKALDDKLHIVILTGYASISTAVEAVKRGATQYLTKPAEPDDIIKAALAPQQTKDLELPATPMSVRRLEWEHLQKVLMEHDGNISAAARALNMHRRSLQRKLQKKPVER